MAKKDPTDLTVEEKLKNLYRLQTVLSKIDEVRAYRGELPLEVQDLEDEIQGLNTRVTKLENEIEEFNNAIAQKKGEITDAQASVERYKKQLDDVKNNREYDTLTKEIEYQSLEIELCEEDQEALAKVDNVKKELEETHTLIESRKNDLEHKRSELDKIMEETRSTEEQLREEAKELETKIESRLLQSFKRIRQSSRNGLGIVTVERDACGGCFNKIPPQRQLDIKMHKKIIVCEYCGRILIDPELAGIKTVQPTEEKKRKRVTRRKKKEDTTEVPEE